MSKIGIKPHRAKRLKGGQRPSAAAEVKSAGHLYLQVARTLKEEIVGGVYPVGSQLPTEDDLCERFSISRYTVREALRRLREDNLVASRQGAGTIVVPPRSSDLYVHDVTSINDLVAFAIGTRFAIESIKMVSINGKLASRTGLASGDEWLSVCGFRHKDGVESPLCWTEYYVKRDFAAVGRLLQRHDADFPGNNRRPQGQGRNGSARRRRPGISTMTIGANSDGIRLGYRHKSGTIALML